MNILLKEALPEQAQAIARLIMQAMNYDCCQYFAGPDHTLADFERVMTGLVMAVDEAYRGRGIASRLLLDAARRAQVLGLRAGLLVDQGNPSAERLYRRVGFVYKEDTAWGSHPMRHLVWGGV